MFAVIGAFAPCHFSLPDVDSALVFPASFSMVRDQTQWAEGGVQILPLSGPLTRLSSSSHPRCSETKKQLSRNLLLILPIVILITLLVFQGQSTQELVYPVRRKTSLHIATVVGPRKLYFPSHSRKTPVHQTPVWAQPVSCPPQIESHQLKMRSGQNI